MVALSVEAELSALTAVVVDRVDTFVVDSVIVFGVVGFLRYPAMFSSIGFMVVGLNGIYGLFAWFREYSIGDGDPG